MGEQSWISLLTHEVHGLLYIFGACLLSLVVRVKLFGETRRSLAYMVILALLSGLYFATETVDPLVYAVHLTPISIALTILFEGLVPGVAVWAAFTLGGTLIVGNDWLPTIAGTSALMLLGAYFNRSDSGCIPYTRYLRRYILLVATHVAIYLAGAYAIGNGSVDVVAALGALAGTVVSALLVSAVYHRVKHQEYLQTELMDAEKYQVIGQMAASISHEIRNPLTTAKGFLQLMGKEGINEETRERYREYAAQGINHANAIISDYLNYAKPTREPQQPIDIRAELDGLMPWVTPLSTMADVEIRIQHMKDGPLMMLGEPKKFQQCMLNILKNGIESMPSGGTMTVMTWTEGGKLCIQVSDTGVGMSEEQLRQIGKPFFTTKEAGTGLGMLVVVQLIQLMSGTIRYKSKPGQGTVCDIRFKRYEPVRLNRTS
ncbi:ATP-binding protein [Paenibacillus methanolicus]|uniref:histidine kinase n=1 Tax=Paenibacillus methanolicus TaxID=582686 RepID=A0A5S5BVM6_9BACL|nr:ATP-binding protein [Paenibacillus methanolicus]TYP71241.1 signal transduction histidine kinase [Paenibacillus methanolicus]